jgi:hypothetical protein
MHVVDRRIMEVERVFAERLAVIAGDDDERVVEQSGVLQSAPQRGGFASIKPIAV